MGAGAMWAAGPTVVSRPASRHPARRARNPFDGWRGGAPPWCDEVGRAELEIVPLGAAAERVVGDTLEVRVLFRGSAVRGGHVTVIPHGRTLPPYGTPNRWDLVTDEQGVARYEVSEPGFHLVVAHLEARDERASGVPQAAALAVIVTEGGQKKNVNVAVETLQ